MAINTQIPMGVQPLQYQATDPSAGLNALARTMQIEGAQNQNALATYGLAKAKRQDAQMNSLMTALQGGGIDLSTPEGQGKAFSIAPEAAGPIIKNFQDAQVSRSTVTKNNSEAGKFDAEAAAKTTALYRDALANVNDPASAAAWMKAQYADPVLGKLMQSHGPVEAAIAQIPTDPQGFQQWRQQNALGMTKFIELNAPKTNVVNTGGTTQMVQTPGLGGPPTVAGTFTNSQSPDSIASNATRLKAVGIEQAGANARSANTIAAENLRAGMGPNGQATPDMEVTAQAIAKGQLPPPSGMALLNPKNARTLARVMEIDPNYDYTTTMAKKKAASDFTTGTLGNSLRSFAVAGQHLDQLGTLVDALGNGNVQLVNQLGNQFSAQTGNPAVTNFNAAKDVVSKEVMKAIVAGGGGVAEREELNKTMSSANSPQQLKGVILQYRNLMAAQHDALLQQRRAAGLPDSTLPGYSQPQQGATPQGWQYLGVQK